MKMMRYFNVDSAPLPLAWDPSWTLPDTWFDPSDLNTMFIGRSGATTPAYAGSPVGQIRDKSGKGNHAVAPTDAARPTLARMPKTGRRNLFTYSEDLKNSVWNTNGGAVVVATGETAPDGSLTAYRIDSNPPNSNWYLQFITSPKKDATYTYSVWLKRISGDVTITVYDTSQGSLSNPATTLDVTSILSDGQWHRFTYTNTVSGGTGLLRCGLGPVSGGRVVHMWRPQLEFGDIATSYQKVTNAFDVSEEGVPDVWYLQGDGIDDVLVSSTSIEWSSAGATVAAAIQADVNPTGSSETLQANLFGASLGHANKLTIGIRPNLSSVGAVSFRSVNTILMSNLLALPRFDKSKPNSIIGVFDEGTANSYLNGVETTAPPSASAIRTMSAPVQIGPDTFGQQPWKFYGGMMYKRALYEGEVSRLSKHLQEKAGL